LRAVRALHDPVWTADGYVSDRWRPVSPVTGRLDAFQWQTPLAALPSDKAVTVESAAFNDALLAPPRSEPEPEPEPEPMTAKEPGPEQAPPLAVQDNSPVVDAVVDAAPKTASPAETSPPAVTAPAPAPAPVPAETPPPAPPQAEPVAITASAPPPLFRPRPDLAKNRSSRPPVILPIVRAPDDPGIDEEPLRGDEYAEPLGPGQSQAGGWRGFLARWGG
jgi:HemY protein